MIAAPAGAAGSPSVIASKSVRGDYAAVSVTASKRKAGALYVRAYGRELELGGAVTCIKSAAVATREWPLRRVVSGRLYRLPTAIAGGECSIAVTGLGRGSIRVQVLA